MKTVARICIIGNGHFANIFHYPSLAAMKNVEIVGICAFDKEKLIATAAKYNLPKEAIFVSRRPDDYQKMLASLRPDGVYAIGAPDKMFSIWCWCLESGFHLFIEKPMGMTLHQSQILNYLAQKNNCITQVSHQRRSSPLLQQMREACLAKGPLNHAIVEFYKCDIQPALGARDRMLDDYTHAIDTARWVCGGEVVKVESHCQRILVPDINWIGSILHFDNGSTCFVVGNWASGRRIFRVSMHAPGICAESDPENEAFLYSDGNTTGQRFGAKEVAGNSELFVYGGFQQKSMEFVNSILSGEEKTSSPFSDVLKTMEICETILAQALIAGV
jgi:virulence factor